MNVPVEIIIWGLGVNGLFLSFVIHLAVRILSRLSDISRDQAVTAAKVETRFANLEREVFRPDVHHRSHPV